MSEYLYKSRSNLLLQQFFGQFNGLKPKAYQEWTFQQIHQSQTMQYTKKMQKVCISDLFIAVIFSSWSDRSCAPSVFVLHLLSSFSSSLLVFSHNLTLSHLNHSKFLRGNIIQRPHYFSPNITFQLFFNGCRSCRNTSESCPFSGFLSGPQT